MLSGEQLTPYRKKLEKTRADLEAQIKDLQRVPEFGSDVDSFEEEADEAEEFSTNQGMAQTFTQRLEHVQEALDRIENGAYGLCRTCGREIEREVLDVNPESTHCKACNVAGEAR